jgi:hypothetical protein
MSYISKREQQERDIYRERDEQISLISHMESNSERGENYEQLEEEMHKQL